MTILVVDANNLIHVAWHANKHEPVNHGRDQFMSLCSNWRRSGKFDSVIACFDSGPSWRSGEKYFPDYKANRGDRDPQLGDILGTLAETIGELGVHSLKVKGMEADDCIAAVVFAARARGVDVVIRSDDKDFAQLVADEPSVRLWRREAKRGEEPKNVTYDPAGVVDKWGVPPNLMAHYLALCGDTSDNIPGVKDVGEKTAPKLLNDIGGLTEITKALLENASAFTPARATNLRASMWPTDDTMPPMVAGLWFELVQLREPRLTLKAEHVDRLMAHLDVPARADGVNGFENVESDEPPAPEAPAPRQAIPPPPKVPTPTPPPSGPREVEVAPVEATPPAPASSPKRAEMTVRSTMDRKLQLEPMTLRESFRVAEHAVESRLFKFTRPAEAYMVIVRGRELGVPAATALSTMYCVHGRVEMPAAMLQGLCEQHPDCEYFMYVESDGEHATYETKRRTHPRAIRATYTLDDAKAMGLYPGKLDRNGNPSNWVKQTGTMLEWRAVSRLARRAFPGVATGIYTPGEVDEAKQWEQV